MAHYRKRPVVIEAVQWTGSMGAVLEAFGQEFPTYGEGHSGSLRIATLEGDHRCDPGDWIVRGIKGEFYPIKDPIFRLTYEPVEGV